MLQLRKNLSLKNFSRRSALFVFLFLFCAADGTAQQKPQQLAKKPRLVLAVVVDQFRYDYLLRFRVGDKGECRPTHPQISGSGLERAGRQAWRQAILHDASGN